MKYLYFFLTIIPNLLFSQDVVPITLEYAQTKDQQAWGLMNRKNLKANHGMLFIYPSPRKASMWMFNCWIDLSVAFLDRDGIIQEIQQLKSYPQTMDPGRSVQSLDDFSLYPPNDPVILFFYQRGITSSSPADYALEVEKGWFKKNNVGVGNRLEWNLGTPQAFISQAKPEEIDKK